MTGVVNTGSLPRLLLPGISQLFGLKYDQFKAVGTMVYENKKSEKHFEEAVQLVGVGMAELKGEGDALGVDSYKQGYARRTVHEVWGKKMRITKEAFEDNLYLDQAKVLSEELAKSLFHAKETNAAKLFNNATSTSAPYVGADAKALLATDHPTGSGGTFSNLISSDISELALENAIIQMGGWVGSDGLRMMAEVKSLLIPRQLRYDVHRLLRSNLRPGTADNDANAVKDRNDIPQVIEWQFLTDTDSWFLLTDVKGLCFYQRRPASPHNFMDDHTEDQFYQMSERYSHDYYDPRAVIGSVGA